MAQSRTETLFFSRWPWSDLSRSPTVKLIMPSYSRLMTSYQCSIETIALSRTETLFFSRWPCFDLSRSSKVKLIMPYDPWLHDFLLVFHNNYNAILHGNPVFQQMTLIWPYQGHQRSNWLRHPIRNLCIPISLLLTWTLYPTPLTRYSAS